MAPAKMALVLLLFIGEYFLLRYIISQHLLNGHMSPTKSDVLDISFRCEITLKVDE